MVKSSDSAGVSAQIYDTDPGSILIVWPWQPADYAEYISTCARNKIPAQNIKIKEFVLSQPHVDYYAPWSDRRRTRSALFSAERRGVEPEALLSGRADVTVPDSAKRAEARVEARKRAEASEARH